MSRRVIVIGSGAVGSTYAFALLQSGLVEEIVLLDQNRDLAAGQAMDLSHGLPFVLAARVYAGGEEDLKDADMVVITAGAKQRPGQSRLDLLKVNAAIMKSIADSLEKQCGSEIPVMVVTNPVDVMTYALYRYTGWSRRLIFGSGTVLDSARFRYMLSRHCGVDSRSVHAYVIGEHGDSEVPAWSLTHIAGIPFDTYCGQCNRCNEDREKVKKTVEEEVRNSAYHIIDYKGATWFAVALAMTRITSAVLRNERSVLTVSTVLKGEYGLNDLCLSVPCIVGRNGIEQIIEADLKDPEKEALSLSAGVIHSAVKELSLG
ncbi:L-lactate dehydrogenase [Thermodesulforhabdus norvegica]|uniref:L-lactate dehydrogenase n=1 Tax=Thermodesulforhabdus norvegica TaxID=39841 RepID=A0A1I4T8K6_9BACT|nr:L-lactate dehydrogenase [Thermodesulforhabdus norvegica]SFM73064.1 L-lactate dehydrogenase [Thermodesulforhabdus norvegica]